MSYINAKGMRNRRNLGNKMSRFVLISLNAEGPCLSLAFNFISEVGKKPPDPEVVRLFVLVSSSPYKFRLIL